MSVGDTDKVCRLCVGLTTAQWHTRPNTTSPPPPPAPPRVQCCGMAVPGHAHSSTSHGGGSVAHTTPQAPFCQHDSGGQVPGLRTPRSTHRSAAGCPPRLGATAQRTGYAHRTLRRWGFGGGYGEDGVRRGRQRQCAEAIFRPPPHPPLPFSIDVPLARPRGPP